MKNPLTSMACSFTYQDRTTGSDQGPYVLGLVELVGGVRILTNFVECVSREVTIGMLVEVSLRQYAATRYTFLTSNRPPDGLCYTCLSRGSNRSRSQSPRKLKASTVRKIAIPGKKAIHQALPR